MKKWLWFVLRWGVAVVGIWWVVANLSLRDHALVLDAQNVPHDEAVLGHADGQYQVRNWRTGKSEWMKSSRLVSEPDRKNVTMLDGSVAKMLGLDLSGDINRRPVVQRVLVQNPINGRGVWVSPDRLADYHLQVPHPVVQIGLISMAQQARPALICLAVGIFPICFFLVSIRWRRLMAALDIHISYYKTFVLYMVGNFYNTFLPGSTGGDVLKAVYVARLTPHRTRAVVSVLFDRIIGMLGLVMLGGAMSAYQYCEFAMHGAPGDPVARKCQQIALLCCGILGVVFIGFYIIFHPNLRRRFDPLIRKLPAQRHVQHILDVMEIYRSRPKLIAWALAITIPVHITVVVSAMLAGMAFRLPISPLYYFVAVPVVVLVAAIPISPQGAGVMEFFAVILLQKQGATVGQAVALTMSIRFVQIFWNLIGGIWVASGGYHPPTAEEQLALDKDEPPRTTWPQADLTAGNE
ncbi:MAG TPA: lysylphosphatidylglycerol synthase transmembrane domain-containing protein [Tepidisphaeraceae bacterium]|nr:lysylphosphatidylglycerol synthase transmembrane domain-containing protein [Tepidisphaeraceae bacterium]